MNVEHCYYHSYSCIGFPTKSWHAFVHTCFLNFTPGGSLGEIWWQTGLNPCMLTKSSCLYFPHNLLLLFWKYCLTFYYTLVLINIENYLNVSIRKQKTTRNLWFCLWSAFKCAGRQRKTFPCAHRRVVDWNI